MLDIHEVLSDPVECNSTDMVGWNNAGGEGCGMRMERLAARLPGLCIILMAASLLAVQPGGLFRFVWVKVVVVMFAVLAGLFSPPGARLPPAVKTVLAACALWVV